MRLGGAVFRGHDDPQAYAQEYLNKGFRAAIFPNWVHPKEDTLIAQYRAAFEKADVTIAEVGVWNNPLSLDAKEAKESKDFLIERLALAEALGAKTCVNTIGTYAPEYWCGPNAANFTEDFFAHAVDVAREVVDTVKPKHTTMSFEMLPFYFLDSPKEYYRFIQAVDRPEVGFHFDPCNCVNSPRALYNQEQWIDEAIDLLGDKLVTVHFKDLKITQSILTLQFNEVIIGKGDMHEIYMLKKFEAVSKDLPIILEHMPEEAMFDEAAAAMRKLAIEANVTL